MSSTTATCIEDTDLVEGDVAQVADLLDLATGQLERAQVPKVKVVVGAVGLELVSVLDKNFTESPRVGNDLSCVGLESGVAGLLEGDGNTGDGL